MKRMFEVKAQGHVFRIGVVEDVAPFPGVFHQRRGMVVNPEL